MTDGGVCDCCVICYVDALSCDALLPHVHILMHLDFV